MVFTGSRELNVITETTMEHQSFQTCEHITVEFLQFERVIMEFLYHFSRLITDAVLRPHIPERKSEITVEIVYFPHRRRRGGAVVRALVSSVAEVRFPDLALHVG